MRKHVLWIATLAMAIGISAVALAEQTQEFSASAGPTKAPKDRYVAGKLTVTTLADSETLGAGAVKPADRVTIFFDDEIRFNTKGVATCPAARILDLDTEGARATCPKAIVGTGKASGYIAGNPAAELPGVITAFNGPKRGKNPTIVLHTRFDASALTTAITAILFKAKGDLGNRLEVTIPPATGNSAVGLFTVTIRKKTGRNQYVSVRCGDRNRTINYKARFNFSGGEPAKTRFDKESCTVRN